MTISSCDVSDAAYRALTKVGFEYPDPSDEEYSDEKVNQLMIYDLGHAHIYQEPRPLVTVQVSENPTYSALMYVRINRSMMLYAVLDSRIVDAHWPGNGTRKKRKDCAVRLYWGPDYVSGDANRSRSILEVRAWMKQIGADDREFIKAAQNLGWEDELIFTEEELHERESTFGVQS